MKYIIPTLKRSTIIKNRTLALLKRHGIKPENIYLFCVGEEGDISNYRLALHGEGYNIIQGKKGIGPQRNFMSEYFEEGEALVSLDDDVEEIYEWINPQKITPVKNLTNLVNKMFKIMDKENATCCGVYPVRNAFYMKEGYSTNLKFCIGQFRCFYNIKDIETSRKYTLLEDYEISLKHFLTAGKIIRFNEICLKANYASLGGGLSSVADRRYIVKQKEVEQFHNDFSVYCSIYDRATAGGQQIDIRFRRGAGDLCIWHEI